MRGAECAHLANTRHAIEASVLGTLKTMRDNEAPSPAKTGDAVETKSDGLDAGQAAARLMASFQKQAQKAATQPTNEPAPAAEETSPAEPETTPPAAEAEAASAEPEPETQAAAEETTAQQPEAPGEGEEVLSTSTSLTPAQQEILNKRIGKEIKKTEAIKAQYEAKIAELESKLKQAPTQASEAQPVTPQPVPLASGSPLANVNDFASLQTMQQEAKSALRFAEDLLDSPRSWKTRTEVNNETGDETATRVTTIGGKEYTEADVKAIMRQARLQLEDHIPQRSQFLLARQQAQQVAYQEFPFLADKNSPEYVQAQAMLRDPWLQMRPDAEYIVGVQIEGLRAIESRKGAAKAKAEAAAKPKPAPTKPSTDQAAVSSTGGATRAPAEAVRRMQLAAEREKLMAKGGLTAAEAAAFLQRTQRSRNSR